MKILTSISKFWNSFVSMDNTDVNTPYAAIGLSLILATPIIVLCCSIIITHFFVRGHNLDAPMVDLLKYMLGAATGIVAGASASIFSKSTTTIMGITKTRGPKPDYPIGERD